MRIATADEMRNIDRVAIEEMGIPGVVLMENAGKRVVEVVCRALGEVKGRGVAIFCGKGNNGGDGLVAARHLLNMGADVKVLLMAEPDKISGDAGVNLRIWQRMGQQVYPLGDKDDLGVVRLFLANTSLVVDAMYGTGFRGAVRKNVGEIIEIINKSGKPVVSVDIPSGMEADTGQVNGPCIRAAHTVTFALPKLGLLMEPGIQYAGELHVADISIPRQLTQASSLKRRLLTGDTVRSWLPARPVGAHKGDFGRVLVVAGSRGMTGAACLAAEAAARAGAGLVTLALPESLHEIAEIKLTEVMTVPLPETKEQTLSRDALPVVRSLMEKADVLALGPGLSTNSETVSFVRELLPLLTVPCVLDADGLNAVVGNTNLLTKVRMPLVLTPHPGEMSRLAGKTTGYVQTARLAVAEEAAAAWRSVVVLKGAGTLIAAPDGTVYVNTTGNPGMATGGSGDVLTGVIAGLLAQGFDAVRASACGVYLHGLAGDRASLEKGMAGLLAGDILAEIPAAIREVDF